MELAAAVSSVLPKLAALLKDEFKLSYKLKGQITQLKSLLQSILRCSEWLSEAERISVEANLARDIHELSYDLEDSIDRFMIQMERRKRGLKLRGFKVHIGKSVNISMGNTIHLDLHEAVSDMNMRIMSLTDKLDTAVPVMHSIGSESRVDRRLMGCYADPSKLVGVDGPRRELVRLLMEKESESAERLTVISITGTAGIGKTSLARLVFGTTEAYFECRAWVSVSMKPTMKNLLIEILSQVENRHGNGTDDEQDELYLIRRIRDSLQAKRYLLVLDDIWSTETWEIIKSALPLNSFSSRVIATTQINNVAESCCSHWNDRIYNIKPLSDVDSKRMFLGRIFGPTDNWPPDLVDVSNKIVKKCSGLLLAIAIMSSLLAIKPHSRQIWEDLYNSIGTIPADLEMLKRIFLLGYYGLPHLLKMCFVYLSIFPEGYAIYRDSIIRSWIAEGFLSGSHGRTLDEVGEIYLNELINRNMIQPVHGSYDGKPKAFRIHGLMLDIIKSKLIGENFITILDHEKPLSALHRKIRRLSVINLNEDHCIPESMITSHMRSLHIFGSVGLELSFKDFKSLRILSLEGCQDLQKHHFDGIVQLHFLRYLNIRNTSISELPDPIDQLQDLTVLDIRDCKIHELPKGIVKLRRLAHLLCDRMRFPEWVGKMTALSCLSQFDVLQSERLAVKELGNLSELRELALWWFPDIDSNEILRCEYLAISLYRLDKLQSLYIHGSDSSVDFLDHLHHPLRELRSIRLNSSCYVNRIPEWMRSLSSLAYVCIDVKEVKNEDLQLFSELPSLLHLSLSSRVVPKEKLVIRSKGFQVLRDFHLHSARADLTFELQAMKRLENLMLSLHVLREYTFVFSLSIDQFVYLNKIDVRINGNSADASKLFAAAEDAIRKAADEHPNHPTVNILTWGSSNYYAVNEGKVKEQELEPARDK